MLINFIAKEGKKKQNKQTKQETNQKTNERKTTTCKAKTAYPFKNKTKQNRTKMNNNKQTKQIKASKQITKQNQPTNK